MTLSVMDNGNALGSGERKLDDSFFEKEIKGAYDDTKVKLVSVSRKVHLNFVIQNKCVGQVGVTLDLDGIKELRDTLNELHPPEPEKFPYEYNADTATVFRKVWPTEPETHRIAETFDAGAAKRIAQALNEAEGL